jgi:asparagine synthase (glutamine-hydrolysing)
MCGIFGFRGVPSPSTTVNHFKEALRNRGPDYFGYSALRNETFIGTTRLAINDLSSNGNQPFSAEGVHMVLNGEIYNFKEIAKDLRERNVTFFSGSDSEVAFKAYLQWGDEFIEKLEGMFAFAIYEEESRTLKLGRDISGEKPLFYSISGKNWAFSSSSVPLRDLFGTSRSISSQFLVDYYTFGYSPSGHLPFDSVKQVEPGLLVEIDAYGVQSEFNYASRVIKRKKSFFLQDSSISLYSQIKNTVEKMVSASDVPVGVFLSSGVDSSILAKFALELDPTTPLFSLDFRGTSYSERSQVENKFAKFGDNLHFVELDFNEELIVKSIQSCDVPIADTSLIPMFALSQFASQFVKVALTGDGADELFFGYPTYLASQLASFLEVSCIHKVLPTWIGDFSRRDLNVGVSEKINRFLQNLPSEGNMRHLLWRRIFQLEELPYHLRELFRRNAEEFEKWSKTTGTKGLPLWSEIDFQTWLSNNILIKSDRSSMANSLELRAPFLDAGVIARSQILPDSNFRNLIQPKFRLHAIHDFLFPNVRVRKKGFGSPIKDWLSQHPKFFFDVIQSCQYTKDFSITESYKGSAKFSTIDARKIYTLFALAIWLERNT